MATTEAKASPAAAARELRARTPQLGKRVTFGESVYNEIMDFYIQEARLLDENRVEEWLALLSDDVFYSMPTRRSVSRKDGTGFDAQLGAWLWDNLDTLKLRVRRLATTESAFAEDPPSRVRRFVSNMTLHETSTAGVYAAQTYLLLLRNRHDEVEYAVVSALRKDIVRRSESGWKLAQRTVLVDQAALGMHNVAIFL